MKKSKILIYFIGIIILLGIVVLADALYIVDETQQVVITQFGKAIGDPITSAGLHVKLPFVQKVNYFERRLMEWDGNPAEILAKDKKFILVDTYARWKIADPLKFFISVVDENGAQTRLDNIIEAATRDLITSNILIEVVRTTNRKMIMAEADSAVLKEVEIDTSWVEEVFKKAVRSLWSENPPLPSKNCKYCQRERKILERKLHLTYHSALRCSC